MAQKSGLLRVFFAFSMLVIASIACVQDCMGVTFNVEGYVVDEDDKPIEGALVKAWNNGSYERPAFEVYATSNEGDYFDTEGVFSYSCTPFDVEISAEGFQATSITYHPPLGDGWPNQLPETVTITLQKAE